MATRRCPRISGVGHEKDHELAQSEAVSGPHSTISDFCLTRITNKYAAEGAVVCPASRHGSRSDAAPQPYRQ
jgi:hypothetical protein